MAKVRSWVGFDVHARSVLAPSMDSETGEMRVRRLPGETSEVVEFCCSLPGPTRVAYEAGPTGYGLARSTWSVEPRCAAREWAEARPRVARQPLLPREQQR